MPLIFCIQALAETEAGAQLDAVAILREAGLCTPLAPTQPGSRAGADADDDLWRMVGVRACAALLHRGRRTGEALELLRELVVPAPTIHPFLSAFELASRLPSPPLDGPDVEEHTI